MTIGEIRALYPHPVDSTMYSGDCYCVGGAICRAAYGDSKYYFPHGGAIAGALRLLNPHLGFFQAYGFAGRIIIYNDRGNFDGAWDAAKQALEYRL